jgi:hypothetical protein
MSVTVTYVIAKISTFNYKLMFNIKYRQSFSSFQTNFGMPSVYNANLTQKCIIGIVAITFVGGSVRPSEVYFADSGTPSSPNIYAPINDNMYSVAYTALAIMECDIYNIVDDPTAPTQCYPCSDPIFNCLICKSPTKCINCMVGWPIDGGCTNVTKLA